MMPNQNPFASIAASLALLGLSARAADITLSTGSYTDTQSYDNGTLGPGENHIVTFNSGANYSFVGNLTLPTAWNRINLNSGAWLNVGGNLSVDVSGVSLNGGTLTTGSLLLHDSPNWAGTLNDGKVSIEKGDSIINGSTVVANQSNANFISMAGGTGAINGWVANNLWLGNSAATIHSNGFDIGITMALGNFSGQNGKLTKTGAGTLTLNAANTYTGTTTVSAGTLKLDFSAAGAPADNIINNSTNSSALSLGSGVLEMIGKDSTTNSQRINGLSVSGGGLIGIFSGAFGTLNASLGAITRSGAGTLDITQPTSGTISATTPGTNNGVVVDAGSAWANFVTVNGGQTWAGINASNIVAFNSYTPNAFGSYNTHTDITANMSSGAASTGDIRFDTDNITLTLSGALNVDAGGILVTPNAATNGVIITGGSLSGNGAAKKLAFFNYGKLTVGSPITGTANGVLFTGPGTTTLSGANTYTGATTINGGTLTFSGSGKLGAAAISLKTGTLNLGTTNQTLGGNLNTGGIGNGAVGTITNGTINLNGKAAYLQSGTFTMNLTGSGASRLWIGGDANATVELGGINTSTYSDSNSTIIGHSTTGNAGTVKLLNGTALGPNGQNTQVHTGTLDLNGQTGITGNSIALYGTSKMVNSDTANAASYAGTVDFSNVTTPTIGGAGDITLSGSLTNGGFTKTGAGTLTLLGANTYSGDTMIDDGTLALSGSATLANSANIVVTGDATLDVSGLSPSFVLGAGRTLRNRGETTAALKGNIDASTGELAISFQSGVPAFAIASGTLTLSSSTVVQISGTFAVGTYRLITNAAGGSVTGPLPAVSLFRATGYLQLSAGGLDLVVTSGDPFNYHIAPTGNDTTGDGTSGAPWQSITKVRDHLRTLEGQSNDITVNLSGGRYELADTLSFTPADSGKNEHYITYQSKPGEQASITGGRRVTGWTQVPGKSYWVASVPTSAGFADYFRQLYVNGVRAERAHSAWIKGVGYFDDPGTTHAIDGIMFNTSELKAYTNVSDLRLSHAASFKVDEFPITAIIDDSASGLTKVRLQQPYCQTRYSRGGGFFEPTDEWMFVQAFEELDEPGEWYHNRTTDQVFYYPNSFEDMTTAQVDAPAVDTLMRFTGTSTTNKVRNLRIQNLILEHGNWLFPRDYYIGGGQAEIIHGAASPTAGGAPVNFEIPGQIVLNNTLDLQFIGNTIRHQGACGIQVYDGARNTLIQGNRFLDLTAAAVIGGRYNHSATREICHNTLISNNVIRNTGSDFMGATLVNNLGHTAFQVVHNDMADAPYCGFHQRTDSGLGGGNGGTVVSFNKVSLGNTGGRYGVGDSAYIYTFGEWPGSTVEGNDINTINVANGNVSGFYLDNSSYGLNVIGNLMRGVRPGSMGYKFVRAWNNDPTVNTANGNYGDSTVNWWQVVSDPNYHQLTLGQPLPTAAQVIVDSAGLEPAYASLLYQVYGGTDLARGKTATASSQWDTNTPASSAVDWNYGSIWHQASGDSLPWWTVDLGSAYVIQRIEIAPRTDMDQPDSRCNFQVQGSNDNDFSEFTVLAEQNEVAFPYRRTGWSNSWIRFVNNPNGFRYLRVKKTSSGGLNFSDFQVFGYSAGFNYTGLLWDSSASGEKTDGAGNWSAPNQWWSDAGNQSWVNGGDATFGNGKGAAGTITIIGDGTRANSLTFNAASSGNYTLSGAALALEGRGHSITSSLGLNPAITSSITGNSGLIKSGPGSLTLSGSNSFAGGVTINAGTLTLGNVGALNGTTPNNVTVTAGALAINGNHITVPNLSVTAGAFIQNGASSDATLTMNGGNITGFRDSGTGKLAVVATNSITLNGSNTFTGGLWIKGGVIDMVGGSSFGNGTVTLGDTSGAANVLLAGHTSGNWGNPIVVESGGTGSVTLNCFGGYSPTLSGPIHLKKTLNVYNNSSNAATRTITLGGIISGSAGLYVYSNRNSDLNRILLSNTTSDFTGPVTINSGTVYVSSIANGGAASSIGASTSDANNLKLDGGTLKYTGGNTTSDRAFSISAGKIASIETTGNLSLAGATGTSTTGALSKSGSGILTLTGLQTYTGATSVNAGTLKIGPAGGIAPSSSLVIAAGAVLDMVDHPVFTFSASQPVTFKIDGSGSGSSGRMNAGGIDISNAVVSFNIVNPLDDSVYVLANYTSKSGTAFASVTPPEGYQVSYSYNGGTQIALVKPGFSSWIDTNIPNVSDKLPDGDPDSDGMTNLLEYVLNGNPGISDPSILPALSITPTSFVFTFSRTDDSESDTIQTFQYGSILGILADEIMIGASSIGPDVNGVTVGVAENAAAPDSITVTVPRGLNTRLFGRLQVTEVH